MRRRSIARWPGDHLARSAARTRSVDSSVEPLSRKRRFSTDDRRHPAARDHPGVHRRARPVEAGRPGDERPVEVEERRPRRHDWPAATSDRVALPAAGADRRAAEPAAAAAQLVDERADDARAGGADRVPERDGAAVDVDACSSSMPSIRIEFSATEANASLISQRSMSLGLQAGLRRAPSRRRWRASSRGRRSRWRSGRGRRSRRAAPCRWPRPTRRRRARSRRAPSLTPGELPAVCEPSLPTRPGSLASDSSVESRRGASSTSTTVSPLRPLTVTATISSGRRPSSVALTRARASAAPSGRGPGA